MDNTYEMPKTAQRLLDMTDQEVFDFVARHLLTQGEPAITPKIGHCEYRLEKNGKTLMCAAGCLIEDEEYSRKIEGKTWGVLVTNRYVPDTHKKLIKTLQSMHDQHEENMWRLSLIAIASKFNLNAKVVQDV